jgi:hypothetical protein
MADADLQALLNSIDPCLVRLLSVLDAQGYHTQGRLQAATRESLLALPGVLLADVDQILHWQDSLKPGAPRDFVVLQTAMSRVFASGSACCFPWFLAGPAADSLLHFRMF